MTIHDVANPKNFIQIKGCSAFGAHDKYGSGNAMSYSRKYAFLNALNLATGLDNEDGYNPSHNQPYSSPSFLSELKQVKTSQELNDICIKFKSQLSELNKSNPSQASKLAEAIQNKKQQLQGE